MKTRLLQSTPNMIDVIYTAARTCYNSGSPIDMWDDVNNVSEEKKLKLIKNCVSSQHDSVLEHAYFTFAIEGIDRAVSHQLVRHRAGIVFSQQSQRYVEIKEDINRLKDILLILTPGSDYNLEETKRAETEVIPILNKYFVEVNDTNTYAYLQSLINYLSALNMGIKAEDARNFLPNAAKTNITMSCNLRELIHICHLRLCTRAQAPIRKMVASLVANVVEVEPWLKPYLVAKCEANGFCNEGKGCGRKPHIKDILEGYRRYMECDY